MIQLNFRDPRPIYEQLRDGIRRLILSGVLAEGSKLPSVRELAGQLAINPNTIQRAYRELEAEGCISSVPGRGSFVCAAAAAASARQRELREALGASARELHALGMSDGDILAAVKEGLCDD